MSAEQLKDTRKHFSKLGLAYLLGLVVIRLVQWLAVVVLQQVAPQLLVSYESSFLCMMIPMYLIGYPIMILLIRLVPASTEPIEKKKMSVGKWICAFIMCYACLYLSNLVGVLITSVIGIIKQGAVDNVVLDMTSNISMPTMILIMVIGAPIAEEIIFRKLLVDRVLPYGEGLAVFMSGIMFGLFHGNMNQFVYAFVLGAFLAFIYIRTRKIIYTIAIHMGINLLGSVVATFILEKSGFMELYDKLLTTTDEAALMELMINHAGGLAAYVIYACVLMLVVLLGIVLMVVKRKSFYLKPVEGALQKGQRFKAVFLNLGMILFSAYWVYEIIKQLLA